ncbi:MAG: penicillin-binding protein activator [Granulosicoccus sp.]
MNISTCLRILLCISLVSAVGACTTPAPPPLPDSPINSRITDPAARRQLRAGNARAAADIYSARATKSSDPQQQQDYLLIAAEILFDRGITEDGAIKLAAVPTELATLPLLHRREILVAKGLIFERDAEAALLALPDPIEVQSALNRARVFETRAQAYEILQDPDSELIARINLENELADPAIIQRSHEQIWQLLTTQSLSTLRSMTTNVRGDTYQGWIELALAHAAAGIDADKRRLGMGDWQVRFPAHPANPEFVNALYSPAGFEMNLDGKPVSKIAILLPLSGSRTAAVSAAIRDGIVAAHQFDATQQSTPALRFYDVGDNPGYVRTAFANAVADGADAVIGPLRKEAVAAIVSQRDVQIPTLTLNTIETSGFNDDTSNVMQFGLAPEDEARAAAGRAAALDLKRAVVFQTDDSRGDRESRAFQDSMYLYGGDVLHVAVLPKDEYDYTSQIKQALAIDRSDARFRRLSNTLGEKLFFEPSIRDDVDVIFLAVTHEQAKSMRTQLDFFYARDITRLGTSRLAGVENDPKSNKDLNSIFYPDAPWVLRSSLRDDPLRKKIINTFDNADGVYAKLYALGADAYQLVTNLDRLNRGERLNGYTGDLQLLSDGRIQRHLDWAQYLDGVSQNVENVEAPDLPAIRAGSIN